jgi:Polyketide cyclase / dehydrase and lipid transport
LFEFTETVSIRATAESVWSRLSDVESWWLKSNPEHISLEIGSPDKRVAAGTEIAFEERVAGITARASGTVTSLLQSVAATWEVAAHYRYCGFRLAIQGCVTWSIEPDMGSSILSAHVWARFPAGDFVRCLE